MKKKNFILLCTLCTALLFSCNKEIETEIVDENPEDVVVPEGYTLMEFTAVCEETKTTLDSGNTVWSEGDQIKIIFSNGSPRNATLTRGAGTTTGTFAGMVPSGMTALYAVYPASAYDSVDGSTVKVTVPSDLTGSNTHPFGAGNIAVAKVKADHSMSFKNVTSLFSFTLAAGSNVTKVEVSSVGNVGNLAGVVPVDCSGEAPPTPGDPLSDTAATSISMTTDGAGTYYMPIVSGPTHSKGLLLRFYKTEKNAYVQTGVYYLNRSLGIENNTIYGFGTVETAGNYYVSLKGDGDQSGMGSENPMSFEQFKKKITLPDDNAIFGAKQASVKDATFHFSAEDFTIGAPLVLNMGGNYAFSIEGSGSGSSMTSFICGDSNNQGMIQVNSNTVNISNIIFSGNNGASNRAAIRVNASNASLNLSNCIFDDNQTADKGGAVWINQGTLNITDCEFTNNSAQYGAAILISNADINSTINVTRGIFKGNHSNYGGAIYVINDGSGTPSLTLTSCTFGGTSSGDPNNATYNGGAISINKGTVKIIGSSFIGNYVSSRNADETVDGGGTIYIAGSSDHPSILEQLSGSSFEANYANRFGGAIRLYGKATAKIYNTCIKGNHSANGGAIYTHKNKTTDVYPTLWIDRCDFDGNYITDNYGTTITVDAAEEFIMNNCAINDNTYNTTGANATKSSWITIDNIKKACFSNCSFIGIPRQSATDALQNSKKEAILGIWTIESGGQVLLVNSIIVPSEGSDTYSMSSGDSNSKPVTLYYTWYGTNNNITPTDEGGNQSGKAKSDFDSMAWTTGSNWGTWAWDGTVNDGSTPSKATADDIIGKINTFSSGFRTWLGGDVYYDRRSLNNKKRGTGSSKWWPGCYQSN